MAELSRTRIDEEHFVARYAQGRLSEAECAQFEDYCVLHPEFARQVSTDRALIRGLRGLAQEDAPRAAAPPWSRFALAASVAVAMIVALAFLVLRPADEPANRLLAVNAASPGGASASLRLLRARGGYVPEVRLRADAALLELIVMRDSLTGTPPWQAVLSQEVDGTWRELGHARVATRNAQGQVDLRVDVTAIDAGLLRLSLTDEANHSQSFEFRLSRTAD